MTTETLNQRFVQIPTGTILLSLGLHAFICWLLFSGVLEKIPFFKSSYLSTQQIYQSFVQVDVVALPDQMMNEKIDATLPEVDKAQALPEEKEKTLAPTEDQDILSLEEKKKQEKLKKADIAKKKAEAQKKAEEEAFKKIEQEANREEALKNLVMKKGKAGRPKLAGNRLSQGTSSTGIIGSAQDKYAAMVKNAIQKHFTVYAWQKKRKISAVVSIVVSTNGRVTEKRIVSPSSDLSFNSQVMQAIDASQPLPLPEDPSILTGGVTIEFHSKE